jgi:hypothetical protein
MHTHGRRVIFPVLTALLVAACGAGSTTSPSPTLPATAPPPTAPPATASPATASPSPPGPTEVPTASASALPLACGETVRRAGSVPLALITDFSVVNDGRVGRIIFTFRPEGNGAATPDVEIRPATPPFMMDPSGLPLEVAGTAFLTIVLQGGTALDADYKPTFDGPFDASPAGGPIVEVRRAGDFEAVSSWVVGLDGPPCVRILPPDGTSRLVIEIETR